MKRLIAYFITISLLLGCVGNAKEATAQAKIQATVKDMSGVKRKLTMDSVKHVATKLIRYNYPGEYAQVADGHYYYMRQTGENNRYTVYRDKGKKVGSFKYTYESPGWGYRWNAFGWHEGKLYVKFSDEDDHMIKIGVVDFKQESIKTICTCKFPASTIDVSWMDVYLYQNKIYANYVMKVKARYIRKVKEYELSSGNISQIYINNKSEFVFTSNENLYKRMYLLPNAEENFDFFIPTHITILVKKVYEVFTKQNGEEPDLHIKLNFEYNDVQGLKYKRTIDLNFVCSLFMDNKFEEYGYFVYSIMPNDN